jgi:uncharacterized protein (TIGR02246 family)
MLALLPAAATRAQQEDPVHNELRALRDAMIEAINSKDAEAMLSHLHENVVVTWMNGEVSRGPAEVKAYYDRMMIGENAVVESVAIKPTVERLADVYGDTAVAFGTSDDHFKLKAGMEFDVHSRWSATLLKEGGQWKIVSFHGSTNLFDNPLLNGAKRAIYWSGAGGLVLGVALSTLFVFLKRSKRSAG